MARRTRTYSRANAILLILVVVFAVLLVVRTSPAPREFVQNQTFETSSDLFFDYETTRYPSNVEIIPPQDTNIVIGIVTDPWNLNFGILPSGGSYGTRHLTVTNNEQKTVKTSLEVIGDISTLISFSKNDIVLKASESASVDIFLNTTNSTRPGNYTGEIDVVVEKPKYDFLYAFW